MSFSDAMSLTLRWEGGAVDDALDPGGSTAYGITQDSYNRFFKTKEPVPYITPDQVMTFYRSYWQANGCTGYDKLDGRLGVLMFDTAVLHGSGVHFLQQALGVPNDGVYGPQTHQALLGQMAGNPETVMDGIVQAREQHEIMRTQEQPSLTKFLDGWLARCLDLRHVVLAPLDQLTDMCIRAHGHAKLPLVLDGVR